MKLTVHCVVKNEEKWVWFAINSVLPAVHQILIYDTGSNDKTVPIIKSIKSKKIIFEEKEPVDAIGLTKLRREQLAKTKTEWFMILDGDEIWPTKTLGELKDKINRASGDKLGVVVRAWNFVGDLYHLHPESINYQWPFAPKNYKGWANLRIIKNVPGMKIEGDYPLEAYITNGKPVQNYGPEKLIFLNNRYLHTTYLLRSDTRRADRGTLNRIKKNKIETGISAKKYLTYPDVLYKKRPQIVDDPFYKRPHIERLIGVVQSPLKEARRKILRLYSPK